MSDIYSLDLTLDEIQALHGSLNSRLVLVEKLLKLKGLDPDLRADYLEELDTIHKLIARIMHLY